MERNAINFVRCLKCQKVLQCSRFDTKILLEHIRTDHPEVKIIESDKMKASKNKTKTKKSQKSVEIKTQAEEQIDEIQQAEQMKNRMVDKESTKVPDTENHKDDESQFGHDSEKEPLISNAKKVKKSKKRSDTNIDFSHHNVAYEKQSQYEEPEVQEQKQGPFYIPEQDLINVSIKAELLQNYPEIKQCQLSAPDPNAKVVYTRRYKLRTPSSTNTTESIPRLPRKRHLYRTSIEKWRPADGTIFCPQCGHKKIPLIKTRVEALTKNEYFISCLLSCWPLCFLPCLINKSPVEELHCGHCKTLLGLYNRSGNCITPNPDYMHGAVTLKTCKQNDKPVKSSKESQTTFKVFSETDVDEMHPGLVEKYLQHAKNYGSLRGNDLESLSTDDRGSDDDNSFTDEIPSTPSVFKTKK